MIVNPTMSLKKIVTQSNCSALTSHSVTLTLTLTYICSALTSAFILSFSATSFGNI